MSSSRSGGAEGGVAARKQRARRKSAPGTTQLPLEQTKSRPQAASVVQTQAPVVDSRTIELPSQHAQASAPTASSPPTLGLAPAGQLAKSLQAV